MASSVTHSAEVAVFDIYGQQIAVYDDTTGTFSESVLWDADLDNADLSALSGARLEWVTGTLNNASLTNASFNYADFFLADISNASLSESNGQFSDFSLATAGCTDFSRSDLANSIFYRANISCANFFSAILSDVDFRGADLTGADFSEATLTNAKFGVAGRGYADTSSSLTNTDFRASDLTDITGINDTTGAALYDANTVLGPADPNALGWTNAPRTTLLLNGKYINSVSLVSDQSSSDASLAGATLGSTYPATRLDDTTLLEQSVGFRIAGVGNNETLTLELELTEAVPAGEVFLWSGSEGSWEKIGMATTAGNSITFVTADQGELDNSPTAGLVGKTLALSVMASPSTPIPSLNSINTLLLAALILLQALRRQRRARTTACL
jgi:uncharacterized protein YjbI with pentapeptide repeats